jgi:hypothetical protein
MNEFFLTAKEEYFSENKDGRIKTVYAYFGSAIYYGQCLEEIITIMIWADKIVKNEVSSTKEINKIIDTIEKGRNTLGDLIFELKKNFKLSSALYINLEKILNSRNYLTHKYFKLNINKFYSELGHLEMLEYFCDFIVDSQKLSRELEKFTITFREKYGLTEEKLNQIMDNVILEETKREKKNCS